MALLDRHLGEAWEVLQREQGALLANGLSAPLSHTIERLIDAVVRLHESDPRLHRVMFDQALSIPAVRKRAEAL